MSKTAKILLTILTVYMVCSITVNALILPRAIRIGKEADGVLDQVKTLIATTVDTGEEDNIIIADEYKILPTTQISDAYKSGDASALSDRDKETLEMATKILDKIIKKGMTDYEKEEAVYLWLTTELQNDTGLLTVIPETDHDADNPYGVLKNRNAVCVGYATTFRLFMQMMDIECKVIHSSDLIHSWDLVKLDDDWYHVDCYSDADEMLYANFNMNDTLAEKNHDWGHSFFPAATGFKYTYAAQNSTEIKNIFAIPAWVKKLLDQKKPVGCCTFKEEIQPKDEKAAAAMVSMLADTISSVYEEHYMESVWSKTADDKYLLTVYFTDYSDDDDLDISEALQERIEDKIAEVFGVYYSGDYDDDSEEYTWYDDENRSTTVVELD